MDRRAFIAGAAALATGRIRRYVRTRPEPRSIEAVGGMAVVTHSEHGAITLVRGATLGVVRVLRGFGEPRYTAGDPAGRLAYVTDAERGEVGVTPGLGGGSLCILDAAGRLLRRTQVARSSHDACIVVAG